MKYYKKYVAVTAASIAAAMGIYGVERNGAKDILYEEEILIKNAIDHKPITYDKNYETAVKKSLTAVHRLKNELGLPGIVVGVSVNGKTVWAQGNDTESVK